MAKTVDVTPEGLDKLQAEYAYYAPDGGRDIAALADEIRTLRAREAEAEDAANATALGPVYAMIIAALTAIVFRASQ